MTINPNKINWLASERVDLTDLNGATNNLSYNLAQLGYDRLFIDRICRVITGFRVEIPAQGTYPGQFAIHSGCAIDRSGQLITTETDPNTTISYTLSADNTY